MASSLMTHASAQRLPYRAALNLEIFWTWPFYGDPRVLGQALVFRGGPLLVDIGVTTRFPGGGGAGAELDWLTRVEMKWRSGGMFDESPSERLSLECQPTSLRTYKAHSLNDYIELEPFGSQFIRCRVPDEAVARLSAGKHTISVDWAIGSDGQAFREDRGVITPKRPLLGYDVEFELRDVRPRTTNSIAPIKWLRVRSGMETCRLPSSWQASLKAKTRQHRRFDDTSTRLCRTTSM